MSAVPLGVPEEAFLRLVADTADATATIAHTGAAPNRCLIEDTATGSGYSLDFVLPSGKVVSLSLQSIRNVENILNWVNLDGVDRHMIWCRNSVKQFHTDIDSFIDVLCEREFLNF